MTDGALERLTLIAHRGYPAAFPENTLLGYRQSVLHGARFVETDVQCTRDGVPVLYHDASTRRLSGVEGTIAGRTLAELGALSAHYPERFGDRFRGTPIPTLAAFAGWLRTQPSVTAFVEIKRRTLRAFGIEPVMDRVMRDLAGVERRCVIISFNDACIAHAAARYGVRTGWVLGRWGRRARARAAELAPEYLFADRSLVPARAEGLWHGSWKWAVYVVDDLDAALGYVRRGITMVETDAVGDMLDQYRAGDSSWR